MSQIKRYLCMLCNSIAFAYMLVPIVSQATPTGD